MAASKQVGARHDMFVEVALGPYSLPRATPNRRRTLVQGLWPWWITAAVLIGAELVTGTFYLLAIGLAAALGGAAAWLGAPAPVQFAVAGVLGVLLTIAASRWRRARATPPLQPSLDVGQAVHVTTWNSDGTARVAYRGSDWDAELATSETPRAETMYIVATRGNVLVVSDRKPRQ
jgi:membrane protein implicated in regulation of membrane protease activity